MSQDCNHRWNCFQLWTFCSLITEIFQRLPRKQHWADSRAVKFIGFCYIFCFYICTTYVHKHLPLSPKWSLRQNTLQLKRRKLLDSEQSSSWLARFAFRVRSTTCVTLKMNRLSRDLFCVWKEAIHLTFKSLLWITWRLVFSFRYRISCFHQEEGSIAKDWLELSWKEKTK